MLRLSIGFKLSAALRRRIRNATARSCWASHAARARVLPAKMEIFREVAQDENVIDLIARLQAEAERVADEARELAGEVPF